jgi:isochorismate synthase EntC
VIRVAAARVAATAAQADAALASLGERPGLYFGVEGGIAGLHPLQATLVDRPALALDLFGNGVEARALSGFGAALLRQPELVAWAAGPARGAGVSPLDALRAFMRCFEPAAHVLLAGALPFAAHRLRSGEPTEPLGILFFPERFFRRDAAGAWSAVTLSVDGLADAALPPAAHVLRHEPMAAGDDLPPGGYAAMVQRALALLNERPLVSLTLSQSYRRRVELAPVEAFRRLRAANPAPATFFCNGGAGECLLGASPDLQLVIERGVVEALPVCGTVARGAGAVGEAESLRELIDEAVDAASLAVCTDALRNDLAPLCEPGSLELLDRRRPMALATVIHAVDRLRGRLRAGCDAWDAIAATAAPVMVTGTPRAEALAAIAELEPSPRGWYGGMIVQVDGQGDALVGTILRAAAVRDGIAQVRTGGDLLAGSSPEREELESRLKTRSLWRAFGLEQAPTMGAAAATDRASAIAVTLLADGDPFAAALRDCLQGLGVTEAQGAAVRVLAGTGHVVAPQRVVAIGDAALVLLQQAGFGVESMAPRHGEQVRCTPADGAGAFIAARYLRRRLTDAVVLPGWDVWASDEAGAPQVLAQRERRLACLLFRPDSLLSQPAAVAMLAAAIRLCAGAD